MQIFNSLFCIVALLLLLESGTCIITSSTTIKANIQCRKLYQGSRLQSADRVDCQLHVYLLVLLVFQINMYVHLKQRGCFCDIWQLKLFTPFLTEELLSHNYHWTILWGSMVPWARKWHQKPPPKVMKQMTKPFDYSCMVIASCDISVSGYVF